MPYSENTDCGSTDSKRSSSQKIGCEQAMPERTDFGQAEPNKRNQQSRETICKYKQIFHYIFGEKLCVLGESDGIGTMGQFQISFFYVPTKIYVTLEADRGCFSIDMADEVKDWNTLYRIEKFDNRVTEQCVKRAAEILHRVLEQNQFCLYKSENGKLYKKEDGKYRRIKDPYAELTKGE